jgi:BMFP domain-containing protein YqiC
MHISKKILLLVASAVPSAVVIADVIKPDTFIVQGGLCSGMDCFPDIPFAQPSPGRPDFPVILRENNVRLSLVDGTASAELYSFANPGAGYYGTFSGGNNWKLEANESRNGGDIEFVVGQGGFTEGLVLSDGSAPDYECTVTVISGEFYIPSVTPLDEPIPAGQPAKTTMFDRVSYDADGTERCLNVGEANPIAVTKKSLVFGVKAERDFSDNEVPDIREVPSVIILGNDSARVAEAVSVGNSESQRRIANLAEGINELDLVTRGQLRKLPFEAQVKAINMVNDQLDTLEAQVSVLESRYSVPVFTSGAAFTFLEGENSDITLTATDSNGDELTFGFTAGQDLPAWLNLSATGALTGTPVNETGRVFDAVIEVTDGYNVVEQTLTITVLDAEVTAVSMAAGLPNGITYVELNAVEGVSGAIEANNAKYQAAIQARTGEELDTPEEIAALVASVNSVPVYTGLTELLISNESTATFGLSATDANGDNTVFALQAGNPDWVSLTSLDNVQTLSFAPATNVTGVFPVELTLSDDFANTLPVTLSVTVNAPSQAVILGDAVVGEVLSISVSDVNGTSGASYTYSWLSGVDAVSSTAGYELTAADVGKVISVSVFFTDDLGVLEMATAASSAVITREENAANTIENSVGDALAQVPTLEDYQLVGVDSISEEVLTRILPILNRAVANQSSGESVDTVEEIEALIDVIMEGQDDDNDGLPNLFEGDSSKDTDRDGIADRNDVDADSDGIRDNLEYGRLLAEVPDGDGDGISDAFDAYDHRYDWVNGPDNNNDGVNDDLDTPAELIAYYQARVAAPVPVLKGPVVAAALKGYVYNVVDVDEDGLINSLDMDSDNDGVPDLIEAGHSDSNEDGLLDNLADLIESFPALVDTDTNGTPDVFELFSNGVDRDLILAGIRAALDLDEDGRLDSTTDVDRDGLMDVIDNAIGAFGSLRDFDGDGIPNHLDDDDDGDGIPDREENSQFDFFTGEDADADGIDDGVDAEVNGTAFGTDTNNNGVRDDRELSDLDGDGIADFLDDDADNDGIRDDIDSEIALPVAEEPDQAPDADLDSDGDGIPDRLDVSNNPGTDVEAGTGGSMSQGFWWLMVAILAFTARARRQAMTVVLALAAIAPAHAEHFSVGGGVGFTRFSPDLNIEPTEEDYIDASAFINAAWHISSEWSALVQYTNLGEASVNTAAISYSAWSVFGQYRPAWAMGDRRGAVVRLGSSQIDAEGERGLNVESNSEWLFSYALGADYQVSADERIELMLTRFSGDAQTVSAGYRILF